MMLLPILVLLPLRLQPIERESAVDRRATNAVEGTLLKTTVTELESANACMPAAAASATS
jgi:hypothetical protein